MGVPRRSNAWSWLLASLLVAGLLAVWLHFSREDSDVGDALRQEERMARAPGVPSAPAPSARAEPVSPPPPPVEPPRPETVLPDKALEFDPARQHPVNLARLRERMPDNLYWKLGAPTEDPEVLRERESEERRWNTLFGKVQSNTATEAEIQEYYAHRRQVSEDFIAFARAVLDEYGAQLPEQERGLYELSIRMHTTRLQEMPGQIDDALARKHAQDGRREQWQRAQNRP